MLKDFLIPGKASFICGGQFGSEAKGAAAAWVGSELLINGALPMQPGVHRFDIVTCNSGAQAGHTSVHDGEKAVVFNLPTAPLIAPGSVVYLNAGAIIDPGVLEQEILQYGGRFERLLIHPNAAIITGDCKVAEGRADSAQTAIASTRKGVGEALARKVLRSGMIVSDIVSLRGDSGDIVDAEWMVPYINRLDLNRELLNGKSVLVEVPQGIGLGVNQRFYPHCTSRECTPGQAASDAGIHPSLCGPIMLVLRTFPIRVGSISTYAENEQMLEARKPHPALPPGHGYSGGCYPDQREIAWDELGVPPEITTVTKRVRRVFTWSHQQVCEAIALARPTHVFLSHVDYLKKGSGWPHDELGAYLLSIRVAAQAARLGPPQIVWSDGPTTNDVHFVEN